jgi:Ca2+-transporting ATPase
MASSIERPLWQARTWHSMGIRQVGEALGTDAGQGLSPEQAASRLQQVGPNQLTPRRRKPGIVRFLEQFRNPLLYVLIASSAVTALVKDPLDAGVIFAVVLANAVLGFLQESRAERALESLAETMVTQSTVVRGGGVMSVAATALVPGDLVLLQAGDKVPADARLIQARDLRVAEAALTGESAPVDKEAVVELPEPTLLGDRRNMVYATTLVVAGHGRALVAETGDATEIGQISHLISSAREVETPLTRKIASFSRMLLIVILVIAALAVAIGVARGGALFDTVLAAIALAVAAIPEGLPAAVTVTLAIGVARMARRKAIIRRLPAVETLGSTTVICSDKTGTLTQNQMTVQAVYAGGRRYELSGGGYDPQGAVTRDGQAVDLAGETALASCLRAGVLCNDSQILAEDGRWIAVGDPTEAALLTAAWKAGAHPETVRQSAPRLDGLPFDSLHKYMATLNAGGSGGPAEIWVKGALEVLLGSADRMLGTAGEEVPLDARGLQAEADRMAAQGLRVLALARRPAPEGVRELSHAQVQEGLVMLGLQGMIDPPRPEAQAAIQACQQAGIQVKMITGDHALTATAIARRLGLLGGRGMPDHPSSVMTGAALAAESDADLVQSVERTAVFARVAPDQKLRLVQSLQARQHVVAMTGDGVNDAPALRQADIGVAMGITGTEVSKEAAAMVLTDDNFATIGAAVEEGRAVFDNLTKIIAWTLPTNLGEGLVILASLLVGAALPMLPIQILWINLVTGAVLGLVLALEPREPGLMRRRPRDPGAPILTSTLVLRVLLVGAIIVAVSFGLYELQLIAGAGVAQARTAAVTSVIVIELFYLLNCRSLDESPLRIGLFSNRWVLAGIPALLLLQAAFVYIPLMNRLFQSAPIGLREWGLTAGAGLATFLLIEGEKALRRRRRRST